MLNEIAMARVKSQVAPVDARRVNLVLIGARGKVGTALRQTLVLAQGAEFGFELDDVVIEPLADLDVGVDDLIPTLRLIDDEWKSRIDAAFERDERWVALVEARREARASVCAWCLRAQHSLSSSRVRPTSRYARSQDQMPLRMGGGGMAQRSLQPRS